MSPAPRHPAQERILQVVTERPGVCVQDLAEALGLTRTAALHHIRRLTRDRLVSSVRQGRRVLHFLPATQQPQSLLGLLQVHTARQVVERLLKDPGTSWRQLASQLGVTPRAVRWHIRRLEREGALRVQPSFLGPGHLVVLRPDLRALLGLDAREPPPRQPDPPPLRLAAAPLDATLPPT